MCARHFGKTTYAVRYYIGAHLTAAEKLTFGRDCGFDLYGWGPWLAGLIANVRGRRGTCRVHWACLGQSSRCFAGA